MARQYMTDGQFEEYCRRQAEAMTTTVERVIPRILPYALKQNYAVCEECGAVMSDKDKHDEWHAGIVRSFRSAFDAIGP